MNSHKSPMKLRVVILLAFCISGCYSQLQYTETIYDSSKPTENSLQKTEETYVDESENWFFNGVNFYPYYKDYSQAEWFPLPTFSGSHFFLTYSSISFYPFITSGTSGYDSSQPIGDRYFSNPILICWNPPFYSYGAHRPSNIHIFIGVRTTNNGSKNSGATKNGPRTIGPDRVSGSQVLPDRTRGTNIRNRSADVVKLHSGGREQHSSAGRSSGSATGKRSRGN